MTSTSRSKAQSLLDNAHDIVVDAEALLAARVAIGSASWSERLRFYLRLGPSAEMRR